MRIRFLPDEPILDGLQQVLGFDDFLELLQASVCGAQPPFVFGVLGDWGSGKTSVLRLLEGRLNRDLQDGRQAIIPIWFDAWRYENEANQIYPLLYAIKRDYAERVPVPAVSRMFGRTFLEVVATSSLALADVGLRAATKYVVGDAVNLSDVASLLKSVQDRPGPLEKVLAGWADTVHELQGAFQALLASYAHDYAAVAPNLDPEQIRFVLLIDDLDRCLPETTIAVLEGIKNHLAVQKMVFVLAMNADVVYQGIRSKYRGMEIDGKQYLEKILNYTFYVPEPATDRIAEFAVNRLNDLVDETDRSRYGEYFREFGESLRVCRFNNPRRIKRILYRYLVLLLQSEDMCASYNHNLARLMMMAECFPPLFRLFLRSPGAANTAGNSLRPVAEATFDVGKFETTHGIPIAAIHARMVRMHGMFNLYPPSEGKPLGLERQAELVFAVTRLV
jgi:hypothetical protein